MQTQKRTLYNFLKEQIKDLQFIIDNLDENEDRVIIAFLRMSLGDMRNAEREFQRELDSSRPK